MRSAGEPAASPPVWIRASAPLVRRLPLGRYRLMNWLCRDPPDAFVAPLPGGGRSTPLSFICDLHDSIAREVCFTGRYAPQETALLRLLLGAAGTMVDAGANWGYFTLLGSRLVGPSGRVVAMEPDPRACATLRGNVDLNALAQTTVVEAAAAARRGTATLQGYDERGGNWGLSRVVAAPAARGRSFTVRALPVDGLLDDLRIAGVDLIKIDVEGAELAALDGMMEGLARRRYRAILIEWHPAMLSADGRDPSDGIRALGAAGYRGWTIDYSPEATRRAAYARDPDVSAWLKPFEPVDLAGRWPHTLWLTPDQPAVLARPHG
jgi:FkbM family methyltransferase